MEYRHANSSDIQQVAVLFVEAFQPSVKHFLGQNLLNHRSIQDIFSFIRQAEPNGFYIAADGSTVAGYLIASRDMRSVWLKALTRGQIFLWLYRWLSGQYGIRTGPIKSIIRHKLFYLTSKHNYRTTSQAQILSLAIEPAYRNSGIGHRLLEKGLAYLDGVTEIKLEVRPDNEPANRLYTAHGFKPIATTADSQGEWLVMVRKTK